MFYSPVTEVATRTGLMFPDASFVFASTELTTKIRAVLCCAVMSSQRGLVFGITGRCKYDVRADKLFVCQRSDV